VETFLREAERSTEVFGGGDREKKDKEVRVLGPVLRTNTTLLGGGMGRGKDATERERGVKDTAGTDPVGPERGKSYHI